jgi:hypothetical protein
MSGNDDKTLPRIFELELKRQLIVRLRESLIDYDILVDDARRDVDRALEQLRVATIRRDVAAARLLAQIAPAA